MVLQYVHIMKAENSAALMGTGRGKDIITKKKQSHNQN